MGFDPSLKLNLYPDKKFGVGVFILLLELFLWVNAELVFGSAAAKASKTLQTYLILQLVVLAVSQARPDILDAGFEKMVNFLFMFFITAGLLVAIPFVVNGWGLAVSGAIQFVMLHALAVAYTEELFFRGFLANLLNSDIIANTVFGVFHAAVYGADIFMIGVAMILGMIFSIVRARYGLMGSWGTHTAWNLKAGGILDSIFKGVGL